MTEAHKIGKILDELDAIEKWAEAEATQAIRELRRRTAAIEVALRDHLGTEFKRFSDNSGGAEP